MSNHFFEKDRTQTVQYTINIKITKTEQQKNNEKCYEIYFFELF